MEQKKKRKKDGYPVESTDPFNSLVSHIRSNGRFIAVQGEKGGVGSIAKAGQY